MRYVCLCVTMTFTMISPRVKKRFPTLEHLVEAGLLHESEKEIMVNLNKKFPKYSKHWYVCYNADEFPKTDINCFISRFIGQQQLRE